MERAEGIEPSATGWKPVVLPLYYARLFMVVNHERGLSNTNQVAWSGCRDSNSESLAPKASALPLGHTPKIFIIII